jgi:hypothetical protein
MIHMRMRYCLAWDRYLKNKKKDGYVGSSTGGHWSLLLLLSFCYYFGGMSYCKLQYPCNDIMIFVMIRYHEYVISIISHGLPIYLKELQAH